jgi:hypothetical protein
LAERAPLAKASTSGASVASFPLLDTSLRDRRIVILSATCHARTCDKRKQVTRVLKLSKVSGD